MQEINNTQYADILRVGGVQYMHMRGVAHKGY